MNYIETDPITFARKPKTNVKPQILWTKIPNIIKPIKCRKPSPLASKKAQNISTKTKIPAPAKSAMYKKQHKNSVKKVNVSAASKMIQKAKQKKCVAKSDIAQYIKHLRD